jgi:hypothetical protein
MQLKNYISGLLFMLGILGSLNGQDQAPPLHRLKLRLSISKEQRLILAMGSVSKTASLLLVKAALHT